MVEKETYYQLNERAAGSGLVDLIDVEAFMDEDSTAAHMRKLQELGVHTSHPTIDFAATRCRKKCAAPDTDAGAGSGRGQTGSDAGVSAGRLKPSAGDSDSI